MRHFLQDVKAPILPPRGGGASSQQQGGSSTSTQITITVVGDENVEFKTTTRSFEIDKNKTWADAKAKAEELIKYKTGYENDKWKLNGASGTDIAPTHKFETSTTVYAVSKQTSAPAPQKITITVAGDEHATPKAEHTFEVVPGTKWDGIKLLANDKINYTGGYKNKTWKFNNASGEVIPDAHQFNENTTVYAESQPITAPPPAQVTITVAGDSHIIHKETNHTFKVNKDETWVHVKALAANKIKYADGYENDTWKLSDELGQDIPDNYQFNTDVTVYAVSKKIAITITVQGDTNVLYLVATDKIFTAYYGDTWSTLKPQAEGKIKYTADYENKDWKLNGSAGEALTDTYKFTANTAVFAESKLKDVTITITGDSCITVTPPNTIQVPKRTQFGTVKAEIESKISYPSDFIIKQWRENNASGRVISDNTRFGKNMTLYAEIKSVNVTITIQGDSHIHVDPTHNTITRPRGGTWGNIKNAVKGSVTCDPGYIVSTWKKGGASGINLEDIDTFEDDTVIYAVEQAVLVPESVSVTPPGGGIPGHAVSYTLPGTENSWKGVFTAGRTVNLNPYKIGKHEVTVQLWNTVYKWAKENGYLFEFDPKNEDTPTQANQPMANISWTDCIAWCNAYTEMKFGNTEQCIYRDGSPSGAVIKQAFHGDKAHCDFSKKGFRLPTEAEWEYAARYHGNDSTNAEQYGTVYLTNLNSASGATKPIGFEGMAMPSGKSYETLCAETARVAVFNKWWNGTGFASQSPSVPGRANVGSKPANKLGLHDMSGNVAEWCWDLYVDSVTSSTEAYPTGPFPSHLTKRVVRGGYWSSGIENAVYFCMTGKRDNKGSSGADPIRGFRLVWQE